MNKKFEKLGFYPADILLPKDQDMRKWAVVACDQFTSEPEYWQAVEQTVGDAPSTLRLILPEANLKAPNVDEYIADINASMDKYLADGVFQVLPSPKYTGVPPSGRDLPWPRWSCPATRMPRSLRYRAKSSYRRMCSATPWAICKTAMGSRSAGVHCAP